MCSLLRLVIFISFSSWWLRTVVIFEVRTTHCLIIVIKRAKLLLLFPFKAACAVCIRFLPPQKSSIYFCFLSVSESPLTRRACVRFAVVPCQVVKWIGELSGLTKGKENNFSDWQHSTKSFVNCRYFERFSYQETAIIVSSFPGVITSCR